MACEATALEVEVAPRLESAMGVLARALLGEVDAVEAMTAAVKLLDAASRHVAVEGARRECLGLPS